MAAGLIISMSFPIAEVINILEKEVRDYQVPVVDLIAAQSRDPFKVLVATILSARTKDEVTAAACRRLFRKINTPQELTALPRQEIEKIIYPVGFYRNKAKYLSELPAALEKLYNFQVPDSIEELTKLPGVGRKTANLVVAVAFRKPAVCVDTHVHRITNIWGYVHTRNPLQTEMALRDILPKKYWLTFNSILVAFGQGTCRPQRPHCDRCVIGHLCPKIGVTSRNIAKKPKIMHRFPDKKRFFSWNVNGLRAAHKKGFLDVMAELDGDIFALQEIKAHPDQLPDEVKKIPGYISYWHPAQKKGYSGTAVYTRQEPARVIYGLDNDQFDREGRVITLEYDDFFFINIYFPNAQPGLKRLDFKLAFDRAVLAYMDRLAWKKSVVAGGDYNVAHRPIDLANPQANEKNPGYSPAERAWMDELTGAGYVDTFRKFNREPQNYTWWSYRFQARAKNIGWRIDYFFVDPGSEDRVLSAAIHDDITGSDHCPVSVVFR